jgi:hypothetical protein
VVVVCKTGNRSELAALMLQARGFDAHNLEGGTESWVTAGLPIVDSEGGPGRVGVTAPTISGPVSRRRPASLLKSAHRVGGPDLSDRGMALAGRGRGRGGGVK